MWHGYTQYIPRAAMVKPEPRKLSEETVANQADLLTRVEQTFEACPELKELYAVPYAQLLKTQKKVENSA